MHARRAERRRAIVPDEQGSLVELVIEQWRGWRDDLEQLGDQRVDVDAATRTGVPMSRHLASLFVLASLALSRVAYADGPFGSSGDGEATAPPAMQPSPATQPQASAAEAPGLAAATAPAPKPAPVIGVRLDGGYSRRELLSLPVVGADMGLAAGAQPYRHAAFWGSTRLFLGSTENGLSVFSFRVGGEVEAVFDRFRIGGGLHLFVVGVSRAVREETILSWGPALSASARVDVIQAEGFTLFARAAIDGGYEVYGGSTFWGPALGGGVDFDIGGGSRASLK